MRLFNYTLFFIYMQHLANESEGSEVFLWIKDGEIPGERWQEMQGGGNKRLLPGEEYKKRR